MSQRYVRFDVNALAHVAAEAVGSKCCVKVEKCPDGMYNKALLLTMEDGIQVVAKIPNPNAGQPYFTTASEVATMDFVRNVLGTPVPRVYAWSSRAQESAIGAEYIIMEKLPGVRLDVVWPGMVVEDRLKIVMAIARYQKAWMSFSFKQFGSLYYVQDLDGHVQNPLSIDSQDRFAVGPTTGREFNDHGRAAVDFDRGPWNTAGEYHSAIGYRETACVRSLARLPKSPVTLCGPGTYQPRREKKLKALQCYLAMIEYLLPTDPSIQSSCLWHGDLHVENIFVDPDNPTEITGIIDWQSTELAPLFNHARQPFILDYDGPPTIGLERPSLPEDLAQLDPAAQKQANILFLQQSLSVAYKTILHKQSPRIYDAIAFRDTPSFDLLWPARNILIDGEPTYLAQAVELEKTWEDLPGVRSRGGAPFPFHFSAEERAEIEADMEGAMRGMDAMRGVQECVGDLFPEQGIVRVEQYDEARDALRQVNRADHRVIRAG